MQRKYAWGRCTGPSEIRRSNWLSSLMMPWGAAGPLTTAMYHTLTWAMVLTAPGFHLSIEKCQRLPGHTGVFLGMLLDAASRITFVPAEPQATLLHLVSELQQANQVPARQLARAAVPMVPLYARGLFQAMTTAQEWDASMLLEDEPAHARSGLLAGEPEQGQREKMGHARGVNMASDASESRYAAYQCKQPANPGLRVEVASTKDANSTWQTISCTPQ